MPDNELVHQKRSVAGSVTDSYLLQELGGRLSRARLRRNWTQEELAQEAGVSRATVQRLEAGSSTQLTNLLRILRALDLIDQLEGLAAEAPVRPLEELAKSRDRAHRERRRATSPARRDAPEADSDEWTWGDDA